MLMAPLLQKAHSSCGTCMVVVPGRLFSCPPGFHGCHGNLSASLLMCKTVTPCEYVFFCAGSGSNQYNSPRDVLPLTLMKIQT